MRAVVLKGLPSPSGPLVSDLGTWLIVTMTFTEVVLFAYCFLLVCSGT